MTDEEIMEDRQKKYGPPKRCFETWAIMCEELNKYAKESGNINLPHLYALKMDLLKIVRSAWNPNTEDNYCDARNYISIAEDCAKK
jgi:hypothetical protein